MSYENRSFEPSPQRKLFERLKDLQGISENLSRLPESKLRQRLIEMVTEELTGTSTYVDFEIQIGKLNSELSQRDKSIRELKEEISSLQRFRDSHVETESSLEPQRWFSKLAWFLGGVIITWVILRSSM